ncbi:hypothetical protein HMI55_001371, partial [Coelomomyces lativittatus]
IKRDLKPWEVSQPSQKWVPENTSSPQPLLSMTMDIDEDSTSKPRKTSALSKLKKGFSKLRRQKKSKSTEFYEKLDAKLSNAEEKKRRKNIGKRLW